MEARIPHVLPDPHQKHLHLLRRPAERARKESHRHALQALEELFAVEEADGLQVLLFGPDAHGELAGDFGHADEAGVGQELVQMGGDVEATTHFRAGFGQVLQMFGDVVVRREAAVVGGGDDVHFNNFDPAAWFQMSGACQSWFRWWVRSVIPTSCIVGATSANL